jgi:phage/plasmid-like protein (TIGR03299 family)
MAHQVKRMAFSGATPWHGLGARITDPTDLDRCREEAGLDWDVRLAPVFLADGSEIPCGNAVVRGDTGEAISLVGPGFHPLSNAAAFEWFRPWLDSGEATIETAGELLGGNRVWILAKVKNTEIHVGADDMVSPYILLAHGHGGASTLAIRAGLTGIRVVCNNTLSMALGSGVGKGSNLVKIPHTAGARTSLENVRAAIESVRRHCDSVADVFRALTRISIPNEAAVRAFVDLVYGAPAEREDGKASREPRKDAIVELFETGTGQDLPTAHGTAWGLWNAITEYETHAARGEGASKNVGSRLNGLAFGSNGARILKAFDAVRLLADARDLPVIGIPVADVFGEGSEAIERVERSLVA